MAIEAAMTDVKTASDGTAADAGTSHAGSRRLGFALVAIPAVFFWVAVYSPATLACLA